jgi:hypothetical protein
MDKAIKKLFAIVDQLDDKLARLDELEARLNALDNNGKLEEIKKQMAQVAANSRVVVHEVERHGTILDGVETTLRRVQLRCPLMKPDTSEFEKVGGGDPEEG